MKESYAIRITRGGALPPGYLPGYASRAEAEKALGEMEREPGYGYAIVYVREYFNRAKDSQGNYTLSTIAEQNEPGAK